jgi:hypothetical protein
MDSLDEVKWRVTRTRSQYLKDGSISHDQLTQLLGPDMDQLLSKLESTDNQEIWESDRHILFATIAELKAFLLEVHNKSNLKVADLETDNCKLKERVRNMEGKLKNMEDKFKKMEADELALLRGQVAFDVDRSIAKRVLNPVLGENYVESIKDMEDVLQERKFFFNNNAQQKAVQNWKELQTKLKWNPMFTYYISKIKSARLHIAHPKLQEYKKERIDSACDQLPPSDRPQFKELMAMHSMLCTKY